MFQRRLFWPLFAALMGFALGGSVTYSIQYSPQHQTDHPHAEQTTEQEPGNNPVVVFWRWTTHDPVAFYTSVLAIFTGVLAVSTIGLWIATILTLKHGRETAQRQLRAYITFTTWRFELIGRPPNDLTHIGFHIDWKNRGQTPALNIVSIFADASHSDFSGGEPNFDMFQQVQQSAVGPGATFRTPDRFFTPEEIVQSQDRPIRLRSAIRYVTVFSDVEFCRSDITMEFRYIGIAGVDEIKTGNVSERNFAVRMIGEHNILT